MNILLTCGPSQEPIDVSMRLTNTSTGELGTLLAETLAEAGHSVTCFRGAACSYPAPLYPVQVVPFTTGADLERRLQLTQNQGAVHVVLHAAALSDYVLKKSEATAGKGFRLTLEPAPKLVASLRSLFPSSVLIGWNYLKTGDLPGALQAGQDQLDENLTDSCVMMGPAYGRGYGVLSRSGERIHAPDKDTLCVYIRDLLDRLPQMKMQSGPESFHALASLMPLAPFL